MGKHADRRSDALPFDMQYTIQGRKAFIADKSTAVKTLLVKASTLQSSMPGVSETRAYTEGVGPPFFSCA